MTLLLTAIAGGLGGAARYWADTGVGHVNRSRFPWGTFVVNVTACLFLGVLAGVVSSHSAPDAVLAVLGTGFAGGYSTFSTALVETVRLMRAGEWGLAAAQCLGMVVAGVAAAALGMAIGSAL
ncbi:CrcB family protein [Demequina capsici]|uniref:Fluoride-specific ion channel FluC n=1 Tax=Demequina capsici TaxID=3075620 RepID=A0AA96FDY3_9MICO|nr:CrcB family protein [Demequina sp. PMTSA13]WNM27667.1 CrcB family protein [Demequina sp. PMTSA13]